MTAGATVSYTEQGTAAVLDSTLTVSDVDNTNLASATVSISSGFLAGDTLNFTNQNGITGSYNSSTGVLTLTGSATLANYQTALRSITFSSTSDNPTSFGTDTSRTITWTANDGTLEQHGRHQHGEHHGGQRRPGRDGGRDGRASPSRARRSRSIVEPDGDRCRQHEPGERDGVDHGGFVTGDTLNFTNQNGITGSYNSGTGVLTLTGSATRRQLPDGAALDHLLLDQRQPDQLRRRYQPHDQLDGQRRRR